jgi:hypothetical protein
VPHWTISHVQRGPATRLPRAARDSFRSVFERGQIASASFMRRVICVRCREVGEGCA